MMAERATLRYSNGAAASNARSPTRPLSPNAKTPNSRPRRQIGGGANSYMNFRRPRNIFLLCALLIVGTISWRALRLKHVMSDQNLFSYDSAKESERVFRNIQSLESDIKHVLGHLYQGETGALSNESDSEPLREGVEGDGATKERRDVGKLGVGASHQYHVSTTASDVVTLIIPLRGKLLPLGHITFPGLCRTRQDIPGEEVPLHSSTSPTSFTRVEVIFAATKLLNVSDARLTLPGAWAPVKDLATPLSLASFSILHAQELVDRSSVDSQVNIAHCIERIEKKKLCRTRQDTPGEEVPLH
ncbi:membrane-associated protein, putative, partial [Bodo saltans]